jgi:hypothetical protein
MANLFDEVTGHLTPGHAAYFSSMESALSCEEQDARVRCREVWSTEGYERERRGACFARMHMVKWSQLESGSWRYSFRRAESDAEFSTAVKGTRAPLVHMAEGFSGARLLIRKEGGTVLLGIGMFEKCEADEVHIVVRKRIKNDQVVGGSGSGRCMWRIDRDEYPGSWATVRGNLMHLFAPDGDVKRRALVVDLKAPEFGDSSQVHNVEDISR